MLYGLGDSTIVFLIPAIIFALYAQSKVKSTFNKYLRVPTRKGYSGYDVARSILDQNGLRDVPVEMAKGYLSDHYDPRNRTLRLSREVYYGNSIASVSVAAHEVGHAIQHARGYVPLSFRNAIFPIASFGSSVAWIFVFGGFIFNALSLIDLGILLYTAAVLFQVVTLPVEFNASSRALRLLDSNGFITSQEIGSSQKVLKAAALTYVAAMATALAQLFRLIAIRNRRS
ncbi:zinc metallopeptidase [Clostridium formicaceticum]|uniref:Peptidase n=1 Tax=Clostridium formicaceticum TaxID=1497 RepID=A0AAC9RLU0_9CLOT|nr:zinc metallopeptidase [Clostridium formicaceticum]AOY77370.1 peptidase [Clostridium formicaceticum]ARE87917.1 Putative neutral zinc metallopeptidase [Clostridium formicaceticum]